jgi:small subunit ribosomal protein S6
MKPLEAPLSIRKKQSMSSHYELIYIIRPDLSEDQVHQTVDKYRDFLKQYDSEDIQIKILGKKRLAYPIQRFLDGIYVLVNYVGNGTQIAPLERDMRLGDEVIRFLTIKLKPTPAEQPTSSVAASVAAPVVAAVTIES